MTVPMEYQHAGEVFERFLQLAREKSGLATRNQTYTMVQAVLLVFRRRLDIRQAIAFAGVLPPVLRAIFVADWDMDAPVLPFADRATLTREVQALRRDHNFAPDSAIADVAAALWLVCDRQALQNGLQGLPEGAVSFWASEA